MVTARRFSAGEGDTLAVLDLHREGGMDALGLPVLLFSKSPDSN